MNSLRYKMSKYNVNSTSMSEADAQQYNLLSHEYNECAKTKEQYKKDASSCLSQVNSNAVLSEITLKSYTKSFDYSDLTSEIDDTFKGYVGSASVPTPIKKTSTMGSTSYNNRGSTTYTTVERRIVTVEGGTTSPTNSYDSSQKNLNSTTAARITAATGSAVVAAISGDVASTTGSTTKVNTGKVSTVQTKASAVTSANNYTTVGGKDVVKNFATYVGKNGIYQASDTKRYGDRCLSFAYAYAYGIYKGVNPNVNNAAYYKYAGSFKEYDNTDKKTVLNKVYSEVSAGRPVVLQVNGNRYGTCRHYVAVVGFKNKVTSAANLTEKDLLIIDSWDGKLETMDMKSSRFMTTGKACHKTYAGYQIYTLK